MLAKQLVIGNHVMLRLLVRGFPAMMWLLADVYVSECQHQHDLVVLLLADVYFHEGDNQHPSLLQVQHATGCLCEEQVRKGFARDCGRMIARDCGCACDCCDGWMVVRD